MTGMRIGNLRWLIALSGVLALGLAALVFHQRLRQPQRSGSPSQPRLQNPSDDQSLQTRPVKLLPRPAAQTAAAAGAPQSLTAPPAQAPMPVASALPPLSDAASEAHSRKHSLIRSSRILRTATPTSAIAVRSTLTASSDVNLPAEPPLSGHNPSDQAYGLSDGQPLRPPSTFDASSVDAPLITDTPAPCPLKLPVGTN